MPLSRYFKGHGQEVMDNMQDEYGDKKGKSVFYATLNKRKHANDPPKIGKGLKRIPAIK